MAKAGVGIPKTVFARETAMVTTSWNRWRDAADYQDGSVVHGNGVVLAETLQRQPRP